MKNFLRELLKALAAAAGLCSAALLLAVCFEGAGALAFLAAAVLFALYLLFRIFQYPTAVRQALRLVFDLAVVAISLGLIALIALCVLEEFTSVPVIAVVLVAGWAAVGVLAEQLPALKKHFEHKGGRPVGGAGRLGNPYRYGTDEYREFELRGEILDCLKEANRSRRD